MIDPTEFDVAHRALEFRADLDALLKKHSARFLVQWHGKTVKLQVRFPEASNDLALTIVEVRKGGRVRYRTDACEAQESVTTSQHHNKDRP